jgi:hypothetical protein
MRESRFPDVASPLRVAALLVIGYVFLVSMLERADYV